MEFVGADKFTGKGEASGISNSSWGLSRSLDGRVNFASLARVFQYLSWRGGCFKAAGGRKKKRRTRERNAMQQPRKGAFVSDL